MHGREALKSWLFRARDLFAKTTRIEGVRAAVFAKCRERGVVLLHVQLDGVGPDLMLRCRIEDEDGHEHVLSVAHPSIGSGSLEEG